MTTAPCALRRRIGLVTAVTALLAVGPACGNDHRAQPTTTAPAAPTTAPPTAEARAVVGAAMTPTTAATTVAVTRVIDGDTLVVADGRQVRLAQVDAPETNECYGAQSTAALRVKVDGRAIALRRPPTGPERDRYGRTLADVLLEGASINEAVVRDGAAEWYEQFAGEDADLAERLAAAEQEARAERRGLWAACASGSVTASTVARAPTRSAAPTTVRGASSRPNCHSSYEGTCIPPDVSDADCAGGGGDGPWYVQEKNIRVVGPDVFRLDADRDGIGCES